MKNNEPKAMQEIHEIRQKMYEETKGMSQKEIISYIKSKAAEHEKKSGIKLKKLQKV